MMNQLGPPHPHSFHPGNAFAPQQQHPQHQQTPPPPSAGVAASGQPFGGAGGGSGGGSYYHPQQAAPPSAFQISQQFPLHDNGIGAQQQQQAFGHLPADQQYHEHGNPQQRSSSADLSVGSMMQQQHRQQQQFQPGHFNNNANPYTGAPFSHSVPAHTPTPTSSAPPQQYQQQPDLRHSASASPHHFSPHAGFQPPPQQQPQPQQYSQQQQQQQRQQHHNSPGPAKFPMAAPPLPQTPAGVPQPQATSNPTPPAATNSPSTPQHQQQQQQQQSQTTQSPASPNTSTNTNPALEAQRISLLLQINASLLSEISALQTRGEGGAMNPQQLSAQKASGGPDKVASEDYIQCLRRVQANLAYLAPRADANMNPKAPPGPAHMTCPPHLADGEVGGLYAQLRELFQGWIGLDGKAQATMARPNGMGPGSRTNSGGMTPAAA